MSDALGTYDGLDILRSTIAIRKAGDGLSDALGVAPQAFRIGDEHYVLLRCIVGPVKHKPIKDTDCLELVTDFVAQSATIIAPEVGAPFIEAQEALVDAARRNAAGDNALPVDADNLRADHLLGFHAESERGMQANCSECEAELDAIADEDAARANA